jgi:hypothetical protein
MRIASKHSRAQYHTNDKMTFQSLLNNFRVTKKKESGMIVPGSKKVLLSSMRHCEQYVYMKRGTIFFTKKKEDLSQVVQQFDFTVQEELFTKTQGVKKCFLRGVLGVNCLLHSK